jgi:carbon-monoxide dehydrogenase small subunit
MALEISLRVNGEDYQVTVEPKDTLLDVLRDKIGLTGTKCGCNTGDCGACTVLLNGRPIVSCLVLAVDARDKEIVTVEGLASSGRLHPLQEAFVRYGAVQCGFCTPGMLMASYALLRENPNPTEEEVREAISGNLCRCTGYTKIVDAILAASAALRECSGPDQ